MPNPHPPVLLPLFAVVSTENYVTSYQRWSALLVIVLGICAAVAYQLSGNLESSLHAVLFYPIFISITQGQVSPFILLSVLLWIWLLREQKDHWAGFALSFSVIKPQLALLLAVPLVFSRPKAFLGFCLGGAGLVLLGLALVGTEGYRSLIETYLSMMKGQEPGTNPAKMFSVTGFLSRAGLSPLWAWFVFAISIVGTSILWRKKHTSLPVLMIGIAVATFASPHLYRHDLSLLTIPLFLIHPLAPISVSCFLLLSFLARLEYAGVISVMLLIVLYYALMGNVRGRDVEATWLSQPRRPQA